MEKCDFCKRAPHRKFVIRYFGFEIIACKQHCTLAGNIQITYQQQLQDIAIKLYKEIFHYAKHPDNTAKED